MNTAQVIGRRKRKETCPFHPKEILGIQCITCDTLICSKCTTVVKHDGHTFRTIKSRLPELNENIARYISKIEDTILKDIETDLKRNEQHLKQCKNNHQEGIQVLKAQGQALQDQIQSINETLIFEQNDSLSTAEDKLEKHRKNLKLLQQYFTKEKLECAEILKSGTALVRHDTGTDVAGAMTCTLPRYPDVPCLQTPNYEDYSTLILRVMGVMKELEPPKRINRTQSNNSTSGTLLEPPECINQTESNDNRTCALHPQQLAPEDTSMLQPIHPMVESNNTPEQTILSDKLHSVSSSDSLSSTPCSVLNDNFPKIVKLTSTKSHEQGEIIPEPDVYCYRPNNSFSSSQFLPPTGSCSSGLATELSLQGYPSIIEMTSFDNEQPHFYSVAPVTKEIAWAGEGAYDEIIKGHCFSNKLHVSLLASNGRVLCQIPTDETFYCLSSHPFTGKLYGAFTDKTVRIIDTCLGTTKTIIRCERQPYSIKATYDEHILVGTIGTKGRIYLYTLTGKYEDEGFFLCIEFNVPFKNI